jgi:mannose-1-phosphate guanylyltransferase/mannose-6-phosphate isomerase
MKPVILSGGSGTRLWPYSRSLYPKQFFPLTGDGQYTLLQNTCLRLNSSAIANKQPVIICNQSHGYMVSDQLRGIGEMKPKIILEPAARNTAPAVALAAFEALYDGDEDTTLLVLPADHVIEDEEAFDKALESAEKLAMLNKVVTFGIKPNQPETGYGYIKTHQENDVQIIDEFIEKPEKSAVESYVQSGDYFWNSGMFVVKAQLYLDELKHYEPDMFEQCEKAFKASKHIDNYLHIDLESFQECKNDSIDYAVMEKTKKGVVVSLDSGWTDIGSWSALWEISDKDESGNVSRGDVAFINSKNNYIQSEKNLIAVIGVENVVLVETDDATLLANKDQVQDVKKIVAKLKESSRSETELHRKVLRPWGYYDSIDAGNRFQVKRIVVNPGEELSLQMHHHRAEHWIVVKGTAIVTRGDDEILLSENQSAYIPIGVKHRLKNPGNISLEIIEVQSGSYLGEDDVIRFEDDYGRA